MDRAQVGLHPRVPLIEGAFGRFSEMMVDVGGVTTNAARRSAREVIEHLEYISNGGTILPHLLTGSGFIAGSLGRSTQEQPLDDIDVYLVLDAHGVSATNAGVPQPLVAHGRNPANLLNTDPAFRAGDLISAEAVVARFGLCLAVIYPDIETGVGERRKTCYVRYGGVNIDLCPVIWYSPIGQGIDQYWMPEGGGSQNWKTTNPKKDQENISAANGLLDGHLLKVVRILKWWNARHNDDRLKGIHLETMVAETLTRFGFAGWAPTLQYLFVALQVALQEECPNPTGLGTPLSASLPDEDRTASLAELAKAKRVADRASLQAEARDIPGALATWRLLFMLPSE